MFDEKALSFIVLARTAPLQHDGPKRRGLLGASSEFEVIEIGAGQTHGAFVLVEMDPR